jgi:Tfp pilus assembly protein PilO
MRTRRYRWFNKYYVVIIILFLMLGLFIWFLFRSILTDLEQKEQDAHRKKEAISSIKNSCANNQFQL